MKIISFAYVALSFSAGVLIMHFVDHLLPHINPELLRKEKPSGEKTVTILVIEMALHNLPASKLFTGEIKD